MTVRHVFGKLTLRAKLIRYWRAAIFVTSCRFMARTLLRTTFWLALLLVLVVATVPQPVQVGGSDKIQHAVAFAALAVMGLLAYPATPLLKLGLGLAAFGLLIELLQGLAAVGRQADPLDWLADSVGILTVLLLAKLRGKRTGGARQSS